MVNENPRWTFTARYSLTQWYEHVHLLPTRVLGQWFCLDRDSGTARWERRFWRPKTIVGIAHEVVVATDEYSLGCYGISLETGRLLWTSHGNGCWGAVLRLLDFIPFFANDLRDAPDHVAGAECFCSSGRVLDIHSGRQVQRVRREGVREFERPRSDAHRLYDSAINVDYVRVPRSDNEWLSRRRPEDAAGTPGFHLYAFRSDGSIRWSFDLATTRFHINGNFYSYRYCPPYVYLVVSEEPQRGAHPMNEQYVVPNPSFYHLLTLDVGDGQIVQDVRVGDQKLGECRLEDVDEDGLLLSGNRRWVKYFERR